MGMAPIKINSVILKGFNDDEIEDITALTLKYPFHIRFIEYMPMGDSDNLGAAMKGTYLTVSGSRDLDNVG